MRRILLIPVLLAAVFASPGLRAAGAGREGPISVNLIIDGSLHMREAGARAQEWICAALLDGVLQEGDYLRIWIAAEPASLLYQGVLEADSMEAVKDLVRGALPFSAGADFAGALRGALRAVPENSLMTCTFLISSPGGLSPLHMGEAMPYLRYSRVLDFSGWRVLVTGDLGGQVREAASAFLSNG